MAVATIRRHHPLHVLVTLHPGDALDRLLPLRPIQALQNLRLRLGRPAFEEHPGVKGQIGLTTVPAPTGILRVAEGTSP
jgi:hypothetical protein